MVACLAWLAIANLAHGQDCRNFVPPDVSKAVVGTIFVEWDRLYREGKLGCPYAVETPLINSGGVYQDFHRGSIATSPDTGSPAAIVYAYEADADTCGMPAGMAHDACIVFAWHDLPASSSFRVMFSEADHPNDKESGQFYHQGYVGPHGIVPLVADDVFHDLYVHGEQTLTGTAGAVAWALSRDFNPGHYRFAVASCVDSGPSPLLGQPTTTICSPFSNIVQVDFDLLRLSAGPADPDADEATWDDAYQARRREVLAFACRFGRQTAVSWRQMIASEHAFDDRFGRSAFAMMELGEAGCPNLTAPDRTKSDLVQLLWQGGDPLLNVYPDCLVSKDQFRSECEVLLALRELVDHTEPGTDLFDAKNGVNDAFRTGGAVGAAALGAAVGLAAGGLPGAVWGALAGWFGSKSVPVPPPCKPADILKGDYDFHLMWMLRFAYAYGPQELGLEQFTLGNVPKMDVRTWEKLRDRLTISGPVSFADRSKDICGLTSTPETENHVFMIETARYLSNRLLYLDQVRQGRVPDASLVKVEYDAEVIRRLQRVLVEDFYEFNSTPYQRLTVYAIRNLRDFSVNGDVRLAAEAVLYYLDAKFALSSSGTRRFAPFRRRDERVAYDWLVGDRADQEYPRLAFTVGPGTVFTGWTDPGLDYFQYAPGDRYVGTITPDTAEAMVFHAIGPTYKVHPIVRDYFLLTRDYPARRGGYLQRFKHAIPEIYHQTSRFLISAGGYSAPSRLSALQKLAGDEESSVRPTTLMLARQGTDASGMIRFEGFRDPDLLNNVCVAENFACGMNPIVPASIPSACKSVQGYWTFVNLDSTSADCFRPYGVHVAVYQRPCGRHECTAGGDSWGVLEAVETEDVGDVFQSPSRVAAEQAEFQQFMASVLANNPSSVTDAWSQAATANPYRRIGRPPLAFAIYSDKGRWQIPAIGAQATQDVRDWALAEGVVMRSLKDRACVEINNFWRNERLVLDLREVAAPQICVVRPAEQPPSCREGVPVVC